MFRVVCGSIVFVLLLSGEADAQSSTTVACSCTWSNGCVSGCGGIDWSIIGPIIGVAVLGVISTIICLVCYCNKRRQKKQKQKQNNHLQIVVHDRDVPVTIAPVERTYAAPMSLGVPLPLTASPMSLGAPLPLTAAPMSLGAPLPFTASPMSLSAPLPFTASPMSLGAPLPLTASPMSLGAPLSLAAPPLSLYDQGSRVLQPSFFRPASSYQPQMVDGLSSGLPFYSSTPWMSRRTWQEPFPAFPTTL